MFKDVPNIMYSIKPFANISTLPAAIINLGVFHNNPIQMSRYFYIFTRILTTHFSSFALVTSPNRFLLFLAELMRNASDLRYKCVIVRKSINSTSACSEYFFWFMFANTYTKQSSRHGATGRDGVGKTPTLLCIS